MLVLLPLFQISVMDLNPFNSISKSPRVGLEFVNAAPQLPASVNLYKKYECHSLSLSLSLSGSPWVGLLLQ